MDHLEQFKQYAALVQQMREAQNKYWELRGSKLSILGAVLEMEQLEQQVDTFPLPWERKEQ